MNQGRVLNLIVRASSGNARSVLMGVSYMLADIAKNGGKAKLALAALGAVGVGFGAAIIAGFVKMAKSAMEFETAMSKVLTSTEGVTKEGFEVLKDQVLLLTRIVPKSAEELADALYYVKSVVFDNADAMAILEVSAKAATIAMADTKDVAKVLTAAFVAYGGTVEDVVMWADQLTEAVVVGRAEYADFATQMGVLIGYGNTLSVSFSELATWMAFLTRRGYSASQASVFLKNTMMKIINPAALAKKKYKELGIVWGEAGLKAAGGLIPFLAQLGEKVQWNIDELVKFFPNLRAIPLLMAMAQDYTKGAAGELGMLRKMIEGASGTLEERFAFAMEIVSNQLIILKNGFAEVAKRLGALLLPMISDLIIKVTPLVQALAEWVRVNPELARTMLIVIAGIAAFSIVTGSIMLVIGLLELLWGVIGGLAITIGVLGAALVPVTAFLYNVAKVVKEDEVAMQAFNDAWVNLKDTFTALWPVAKALWNAITGNAEQVNNAAEGVRTFAEWLRDATAAMKDWAQSNAPYEMSAKIVNFVRTVEEGIGKVITWFKEHTGVIKAVVVALGGLMIFNLLSGPLGAFWAILTKIPGAFTSMQTGVGRVVTILGTLWSGLGIAGGFITTFIGKVQMIPVIWGYAIGLGSKFLTILSQFSPLLGKFGDLALTVFTRVGGVISTAVSTLTSGGFAGIITGIQTLFVNLGGAISSAFATISGQGVLAAVSGALSSVGSALAGVVAAAAPFLAIIAAIAGVAMFLYTYWDKVKMVFASTSPFIQNLIGVFKPLIEQIQSQFKPLWEAVVNLFEQLKPILMLIGGIIVGVVVVALGLLTGLLAGVAGALSGVIQAITGVINFFSGLVQVIVGFFQFLWGVITANDEITNKAIQKMWDGVKKMWEGIKGIFSGMWNAISGFLKGLWDGIVGFFTGLWDTLVGHSIIPDMINAIINWFVILPIKVLALVASFVQGIIDKIAKLASDVKAKVASMVTEFVNKVVDLKNSAVSKAGELVTAFANKVGEIIAKVKEKIQIAVNTVKNFASQFVSAGKDIVQGIINGIGEKAGALYDKARNIARNALNAIKNFLGISSPSRVMAEVGGNVGQGLINGIAAMTAKVKDASANMVQSIADPMASMTPAMSVGYGMSVTQTVIHKVEFGSLPDGLTLDLDAQQVADLLTNNEKAIKQVSRKVSIYQSREIR